MKPADLDFLRRTVDPYQIPGDWIAVLRWADGQDLSPWWPFLQSGPLLSARRSAEHYAWFRERRREELLTRLQWNPLWLPIAHEGWFQAGVEMVTDRPGVVIDAPFGDLPRVLFPSLTALFDLTADMLEDGLAAMPPNDRDTWQHWIDARQQFIDERPEWSAWAYGRTIPADFDAWPAHWRAADSRSGGSPG